MARNTIIFQCNYYYVTKFILFGDNYCAIENILELATSVLD